MQKTILITGCSSGIGYATAQLLRKDNWRVYTSCRRSEDVARLRAEGFHCLQLDITSDEQISAAIKTVITEFGHLDAIFCNAGYGQTGAVEDLSRIALQEQFNTNVFGTWQCINAAMKVFRRQQHGRILVNSSILGYAAMPWRSAYTSSKFALEGLCDTLRQEIHRSGIYISLLEPGPITTRFRPNALVKFKQYIEVENSVHRTIYQAQLNRLQTQGSVAPFALTAEQCATVCARALNARKPKARYPVTIPAHLFWYLKKCLPICWLDWLCRLAVHKQGK
jgi:NAD(P)-dependent dehydrogenase (short-subunit alcohol dehydrogenase family)